MNELNLRIATLLSFVGVGLMLLLNTCAVDRLEQQVIRQSMALERMQAGGSVGRAAGPALNRSTSTGAVGEGTGRVVVGFNGAAGEILYVEGAANNAPLTVSEKPKPQGDTYVSRRTSAPSSLNFYTTNEGDTNTITTNILDRLMIVDPKSPPEVLPSLATSWEVSEDQLTYTYHLRRGVLFADGNPFTSADVLFSYETMRDPEVRSEHMRSSFEDVVSLETPDDYTVVVTYRKQYWAGIYAVGFNLKILNKKWVESFIPKLAAELDITPFSIKPGTPGFGAVFNKVRVPGPGTGPYYYPYEKFDQDVPIELIQNPFHWGTQVHPGWYNFSKLKWVFIQDPVAAFEEFRREGFDVTVVDFQAYDDEYSTDEDINALSNYWEYDHIGLGFSFISWNTRQPPFDDPLVRRAMAHLMDRQWVADEINRGRATIAQAPCKRSYPCYDNNVPPLEYDLEKAKALLAEAGWTDSDGDGILDRNGERFEFELKLGSTRRFYTQVAAALQDSCKKVGIRMNTRTLEWSTFIQDFYDRRFDAVSLYSSFADPWIDPYDGYHSSGDVPQGGNDPGWHNDRVDTILTEMRQEFDADKRTVLWHEFNLIFQQEQPQLLINHSRVGVLQHTRFEGVEVLPTGLRMNEYWVKPENRLYQ